MVEDGREYKEHERTAWSAQELKDRMKQACLELQPGLCAYGDLPPAIDFDTFATKARECIDETEADPRRRERGANILWEPKTQRIVQTKRDNLTIGSEDSVDVTPPIVEVKDLKDEIDSKSDSRSVYERYTRPIGFTHSHPSGNPFSPTDVAALLRNPFNKLYMLASAGGRTRALVTTRETAWNLGELNDTEARSKALQEEIKAVMDKNVAARRAQIEAKQGRKLTEEELDQSFKASVDAIVAYYAEKLKLGYYVEHPDTGEMRRMKVKKKAS